MKRIIMLIGGAICFAIGTIEAQISANHLNPTPKTKKKEIGITLQDHNSPSLFYRKEFKTNKFYRVDGGFTGNSFYRNTHIGVGIEKRVPLSDNGKWEAYHGWNLNWYGGKLRYNNDLAVFSNTISVGYRLGARYNINKRFFVGAEINPQVGFTRSNHQIMDFGNQIAVLSNNRLLVPTRSIGGAKLTLGMKF